MNSVFFSKVGQLLTLAPSHLQCNAEGWPELLTVNERLGPRVFQAARLLWCWGKGKWQCFHVKMYNRKQFIFFFNGGKEIQTSKHFNSTVPGKLIQLKSFP